MTTTHVAKTKEPKIIKVDLAGLVEDPDNPNKMTAEEFALLVKVVRAEGMVQPILVQLVDGVYHIVDGHHRARAAKEAGIKQVYAVLWDGTPEMRRAMGIGMNKIRGELDLSAVQRIITDLHESGWTVPALTVTGYSETEITDLLALAEANTEDIMEGAVPSTEDRDRDDVGPGRPLILELTFTTSAELQTAKRGLRRAAGKGRELGEGLLKLLSGDE